MWKGDWRSEIWDQLADCHWDLIVIGGGITGAGILLESSRAGFKTLLVEQRDFGWGTSSRSSKLVHGGLRYLQQGQIRIVRELVHERNRLVVDAPGLVEPLGFLLANYKGKLLGRWTYELGLSLFDLLDLKWQHKHFSRDEYLMLAPHVSKKGLEGGFQYYDAQTDDSRLVLRVIREAVNGYGTAINYVRAEELLRENKRIVGLRLRDVFNNRTIEVRSSVIINASGVWTDRFRSQVGEKPCLRPLRGSHIVFPYWRLPVAQAIAFAHPRDRRHLFAIPWEGAVVVGTTDVDHERSLDDEPGISEQEADYIMEGLQSQFPSLGLNGNDVVSSFAGIRPVIASKKANPSGESRDYMVKDEKGLITVTGGKLTNFRRIAFETLKMVRRRIRASSAMERNAPVFKLSSVNLSRPNDLDANSWRRILGRYGSDALAVVSGSEPGEMEMVPGTRTLWAELRWASRAEGVLHLDDLLLRRTRIGLLLPQGGVFFLPRIRSICQRQLGWDDPRWDKEVAAYSDVCRRCYSLPGLQK